MQPPYPPPYPTQPSAGVSPPAQPSQGQGSMPPGTQPGAATYFQPPQPQALHPSQPPQAYHPNGAPPQTYGQNAYGQNPNPYPYGPPPVARGVPVWVWVGLGLGVLGIFAVVAVLGVVVALGRSHASEASANPDEEPAPVATAAPTARAPRSSSLPQVQRNVPHHNAAILSGCSSSDIATIERGIDSAIKVGAPIYNAGDFEGCYATYDRAALRVETTLSASCSGPTNALETGRLNARAKSAPADRAWAMRDAFDGLLDVIDRTSR